MLIVTQYPTKLLKYSEIWVDLRLITLCLYTVYIVCTV